MASSSKSSKKIKSSKSSRTSSNENVALKAKEPKTASPEQASVLKGLSKPPTDHLQKFSTVQVLLATQALLQYTEKQKQDKLNAKKKDLLDSDEDAVAVWCSIGLKQVLTSNPKVKPVPLSIPHPFFRKEKASVCLFVKDPADHYRKLLEEKNVHSVTEVIGITQLKKEYQIFEAKRNLRKSHDIFLADDRIVPLLPKLIGKTFYESKRQPAVVDLKKRN